MENGSVGLVNSSNQEFLHNFARDIGEAEVPALELVSESSMIDPEAMQDRGLQVMHVHRISHDVIAIVVRFADCDSRLYAATR